VYGIVTQSGGHIVVRSQLGAGSSISVYLPRVADAGITTQETKVQEPTHPEGSETVLLVDDEDELRNVVAEYLEARGYLVLRARDGVEGVEVADRHQGRIGLLITDMVMPRMGGRGLIEHIAKKRPETAILVISGYANDALIRHGILLNKTCFLQKPFTLQILGNKIRELLDKPVESR